LTNGRDTVKLIKTNPLNRGFLNKMPKLEEPENKEKSELKSGIYKGYSIAWLRKTPEHPDFKLVEEFDELNKK